MCKHTNAAKNCNINLLWTNPWDQKDHNEVTNNLNLAGVDFNKTLMKSSKESHGIIYYAS